MATNTTKPLPCSNNDGLAMSECQPHKQSISNQLCKK